MAQPPAHLYPPWQPSHALAATQHAEKVQARTSALACERDIAPPCKVECPHRVALASAATAASVVHVTTSKSNTGRCVRRGGCRIAGRTVDAELARQARVYGAAAGAVSSGVPRPGVLQRGRRPLAVPLPVPLAEAAAVSVRVAVAAGVGGGGPAIAPGRRGGAGRAAQRQQLPHLHLLGVLAGGYHDVHQQIDQRVLRTPPLPRQPLIPGQSSCKPVVLPQLPAGSGHGPQFTAFRGNLVISPVQRSLAATAARRRVLRGLAALQQGSPAAT